MAGLLAELDHNVAEYGWQGGAQRFLPRFVQSAQVSGAESLPREGPLLVVSNHPAAYDVIILAASLPRDDLKIISSPVSVVTCLPAVAPHFIFISENAHERMGTVRAALRHLREGGALLIFPRGDAEPDPAVSPGALQSLERWWPSVDLFLQKAPQTQTVISVVSGVLSPRWFRSPLVRLWKRPEQRQKIAEILQVVQQLVWSKDLALTPTVTLSPPLTTDNLNAEATPPDAYLKAITARARQMLVEQAVANPELLL
jgi:1-acyl-sn-glycerol-3-phosphate acyltransferase